MECPQPGCFNENNFNNSIECRTLQTKTKYGLKSIIAESVKILTYSRLEVVFKDVPKGIYDIECKTSLEEKVRVSTRPLVLVNSALNVIMNATTKFSNNEKDTQIVLQLKDTPVQGMLVIE